MGTFKPIYSVGVICATLSISFVMYRYKIFDAIKKSFNLLKYKPTEIIIVNTIRESEFAAKKLLHQCSVYRAIGFDCEWVNEKGKRKPVALIQLASKSGLCLLIRLCKLQEVPESIKNILEDDTILKVGVGPIQDSKYLNQDYGVCMKGIVDIRNLKHFTGATGEGLASLAKNVLNVQMDKTWYIRCSNWELSTLTQRQINYAASDALISILLLDKLVRPTYYWWQTEDAKWKSIENSCKIFMEKGYKEKKNCNEKPVTIKHSKVRKNSHLMRFNPLYDNCILQAPDGDTLCTCNRGKAEWYLSKNLAKVICSDPLIIRLTFPPSGRPVGEVGEFYTHPRENCCVVCGKTRSYSKKYIVPHEYRKYFPDTYKSHQSHDIVLLCIDCHRKSNYEDWCLRRHLEIRCNAPIGTREDVKYYNQNVIRKVVSAARALIHNSFSIPEDRKAELRTIILSYFENETEVTYTLLEKAAELPIYIANTNYEPHGKKVVNHFVNEGPGILNLEILWRQHFLKSMKPEYLPKFWSLDHTEQRLLQKASKTDENDVDLTAAVLI